MYHVSGDDVGTAVRLRQVVKYGNAYMRGQVGGPGPSAFIKLCGPCDLDHITGYGFDSQALRVIEYGHDKT